jgi:hypothetical protein
MKKGRGRPSLPKSEKRFVYPLRISRNELNAFDNAAAHEALQTPAWIRKTLTERSAQVLAATAK